MNKRSLEEKKEKVCHISSAYNTDNLSIIPLDRLFITRFLEIAIASFSFLLERVGDILENDVIVRVYIVRDIYLFSINQALKSPFGPSVNQIKKRRAVKNGTKRLRLFF